MSYGGDILVESVPGTGTTFSIYLPQLSTTDKDEEVSRLPLDSGDEHILLVDDEEGIVHVTQTLLVSLGYMVTACTNSLEALAQFRENPHGFDLAITDLTMPKMNGMALAEALLQIRPDLPILLISGAHDSFTEERAQALGVDTSLMKPFLAHELSSKIRDLLDAKGA